MINANSYTDFFKVFGEFKAPNFDFNGLFATQRRNIEALTAIGQIAAESVQEVSRRQAEAVRSGVEGYLKASKDALTGGSPEATAAKQADYARGTFESAINHMREVSEMVTKSSFEAFDVLNKRAAESLEEFSSVASRAASSGSKKK